MHLSQEGVGICGGLYLPERGSIGYSTNINHKGPQRTANENAGERRIYKDLISKNEK